MSKAKINNTYTVTARVVSINSIEITANSLEDAAVKAKELDSEDFVKDLGDPQDGSFKVFQVYKTDSWDTE